MLALGFLILVTARRQDGCLLLLSPDVNLSILITIASHIYSTLIYTCSDGVDCYFPCSPWLIVIFLYNWLTRGLSLSTKIDSMWSRIWAVDFAALALDINSRHTYLLAVI